MQRIKKIKRIRFIHIYKIANILFDIFCLEDEDFVDQRKTSPKYKQIDRILKNVTNSEKEQSEIYHAIDRELFNREDYTYKCMCDNLRELGYEITYD